MCVGWLVALTKSTVNINTSGKQHITCIFLIPLASECKHFMIAYATLTQNLRQKRVSSVLSDVRI